MSDVETKTLAGQKQPVRFRIYEGQKGDWSVQAWFPSEEEAERFVRLANESLLRASLQVRRDARD